MKPKFAPSRSPTVKLSKVHWEPIKRRHTSASSDRSIFGSIKPDSDEEKNQIYSELEALFAPKRAKTVSTATATARAFKDFPQKKI